jgi:putative transposon-encoded protein
MKKVEFYGQNELKVKNIKGFMKRKVVISGTSAKINVPKEYLDYDTCLIILEKEGKNEKHKSNRRNTKAKG